LGDTTNWEFAAAVAAVGFGLGGLLLFTLIGTIGSWRMFSVSSRAANEAAKASLAVQDLARYLSTRETMRSASAASGEADHFADLRRQADALVEQQARLQDAVRNLIEAGVLRSEDSGRHLGDLEASVRRLEEHLSGVAAAVANLAQKQG
jgi:hypothetical protein